MFLEQLYTGWIVVVHLCFGFSLWRQMAPQQSAKFRTAVFVQFRTSLWKHSVASYASIRILFSVFVRGPGVLYNSLNILQFRRQMAPQESLMCGGNIPKRKNSDAQLCEIFRILTIYIVINSTLVQQHMRVTISCRYALSSRGRCFCFLFVFVFVFLPAGLPRCRAAANCRYCFYSQAKNEVFRPTGATRCTDSGHTLHDRRASWSAWLCEISRQSVQRAGNAVPKISKKFTFW